MQKKNNFFQEFIKKNIETNTLVVQPRMGFSSFDLMRNGLLATKELNVSSIGTITIDSFTRLRDFKSASEAIRMNKPLNGYPIVSYSQLENENLISGVREIDFPVQVRHGCPMPEEIFRSTINANIDSIEGGPISYCLPYGRIPLSQSISSWMKCCEIYAKAGNGLYHIESFGGCMMGQLCPPSLLISITLLEAIFFKRLGIKSVSLSLAQGYNDRQDLAALRVLNLVSKRYLGDSVDWHIVYYTFMGKFPKTKLGAESIIKKSAIIAKNGGAHRLIVKTVKEAYQIPTINDNLEALKLADKIANKLKIRLEDLESDKVWENQILDEVNSILEVVLNISPNIEKAIKIAFEKGYLDVPFCLHQDNKKLTQSRIDSLGNIYWANRGKMPLPGHNNFKEFHEEKAISSSDFLKMLSFNEFKYDYNPCFD